MSVISAIITRICTVHASDSLITQRQADGVYEVKETRKPKIVRIPHWRGAIAYWGLAQVDALRWSTVQWLEDWSTRARDCTTPEDFANATAVELAKVLSCMKFRREAERGLGMHFSAYERVGEYWIPELFLISNWLDTTYRAVRPEGLVVTRETFHAVSNEPPQERHRETTYRLKVHRFLNEGNILSYNNGDPGLYNSAAIGFFAMFQQLAGRGALANPEAVETWTSMARRPIEIVGKAQRDFCPRGRRLVGGKPHDLAVTPAGIYTSTTGD